MTFILLETEVQNTIFSVSHNKSVAKPSLEIGIYFLEKYILKVTDKVSIISFTMNCGAPIKF